MKIYDLLETSNTPYIDPRAVEVFRDPDKILEHLQFWLEIQEGITTILRILPVSIPDHIPILFDQLFKAVHGIAQYSTTPEDYAFSQNTDLQKKIEDISSDIKESIGYNIYKHFNSLVNDLNKNQYSLNKAINLQPMTGYF